MYSKDFESLIKKFWKIKIFINRNLKKIIWLFSIKKWKKFLKKLEMYFLFLIHEEIVKKLFGNVNGNFKDFVLSENANKLVLEYLNNLFKEQSSKDQKKLFKESIVNGQKYSAFLLNDTLPVLDEFLKNTHSHVSLDPFHPTTQILHEEIKRNIDGFINSPYAFINSHAWKTYPNSKSMGPNALHTDMFEAGHLKIMIYPNGLNGKNGGFYLKNYGQFSSCPKGFCICFKNSDVMHNGIPGSIQDRDSIEVTIQRTFAYLPQKNQSHIDGRHLKSPMDVYLIGHKNLLNLGKPKNK